MGGISDDAIRHRAYLIWEREGRPHGRDYEHWVQAQIELAAETRRNGKPPAAPARKAAPKAKTVAAKKPAVKAPAKTTRAAAGRTAKAKAKRPG
ncbi:MAG: DUF2934 domain-containing protein [Candidatus Binatia bacterium]